MPVASLTHSITQFVGANGIYAVFLLMCVDAVFPAASELVMVYGGALAAGTISGQRLTLFGHAIDRPVSGYLLVAAAGTVGYLAGSWLGWAVGYRAGRRTSRSISARSMSTRTSSPAQMRGFNATGRKPFSSGASHLSFGRSFPSRPGSSGCRSGHTRA
jgi:hypothetical protein